MIKSHIAVCYSIVVFLCAVPSARAIPAFARQYGTSCATCHVDFPKLNDFGKAFKDAGFKFPKDDESFIKIPPVMLGSPAQKELWPHTISPGTIPGLPPIGLRFNTFFQLVGKNRNNFNLQFPPGQFGPFIPRTDFQPGLFSIFMAGNFGSDIAFWVDDDISVGGSGASGGLRIPEVRQYRALLQIADRRSEPAHRPIWRRPSNSFFRSRSSAVTRNMIALASNSLTAAPCSSMASECRSTCKRPKRS